MENYFDEKLAEVINHASDISSDENETSSWGYIAKALQPFNGIFRRNNITPDLVRQYRTFIDKNDDGENHLDWLNERNLNADFFTLFPIAELLLEKQLRSLEDMIVLLHLIFVHADSVLACNITPELAEMFELYSRTARQLIAILIETLNIRNSAN